MRLRVIQMRFPQVDEVRYAPPEPDIKEALAAYGASRLLLLKGFNTDGGKESKPGMVLHTLRRL